MIVPLSAIARDGSLGMMRLSTMKVGLLGPLMKVATLPAGRKSIGGPPMAASVGLHSKTALGESTRIVSLVAPVGMRVAAPQVTTWVPWKAWASARPASKAAAALP